MSGHLYAIGVGPGDPDLLTLKAAKTLARVDIVFAASSTKNKNSLALDIARPHVCSTAHTVLLGFPMSQDEDLLRRAWTDNARQVLAELDQGRDAAFLTLGDPLLYSTFIYLLRTLRQMRPDLAVTIIPGITSFQAVAAATQTVLAENVQNLLIMPGIRAADDLRTGLNYADNAIVLKTYTNFACIREEVQKIRPQKHCVFASKVGMKDEFITHSLDEVPSKPAYLSLLLLTVDQT